MLNAIIPDALKKHFHEAWSQEAMRRRAQREKQIPKVRLERKHSANCRLLQNRIEMLEKLPPSGIVAEMGVNEGDFSERILEICTPSKLHLIDTWGSARYHDGLYASVRKRFEEPIRRGQVVIHRAMSTQAAEHFEDGYFDWVYIDTEHSYEVTRDELLKYEYKVKANGIIAGHDYSQGNWIQAYRYGVIEAVHEFCVKRNWELIYLTVVLTESPSFAIRRLQDRQRDVGA